MSWTGKHMSRVFAVAALALFGCAGAEPRQVDQPVSATGPSPLQGARTSGEGERFVMSAVACWMGGLWADAVTARSPSPPLPAQDRAASVEERCTAVLVHTYGAANPMQYEQLRAADPIVVDALAARARAISQNDAVDGPQADNLVKLLHAAAYALRENILARGPADDVKQDQTNLSNADQRVEDKRIAAQALRRSLDIGSLLSLDAGPFSQEARAIGLLCALDRLEIARKLPKHLKVYAVGGPFVSVFGVRPPAVSDDAAAPIPTGTWPGYLVDVAAASGHAVPAAAVEPLDREALAWGGVLQGFADQLRAEAGAVSARTPLPLVLGRTADRLDQEGATLRALFRAEQRAQR